MSDEGEKTCPLCAEEMDLTDQQLKPCKCGYEICVWCWHHIMEMAEKDESEGRCPACRTPYDKERIVGTASKCERLVTEISMEKKVKSQKAKTKSSDGRKQLSSVRVIQRNLVYIVGLPLNLADEDLLTGKEYFAQYGKILKVSISRTSAGTIQQFANNSCSVYITYSKEEEAVRCIQSVHGFNLEGRSLRACFGTTKYCHAWLRSVPCTNPECLYLHEIGSTEDSFTKDEIISAYSRVQQITGISNNVQHRAGAVLPPPADDYCSDSTAITGKPVVKSTTSNAVNNGRVLPAASSANRTGVLPPAASWGTRAPNCMPSTGSLGNSNGSTNQNFDSVGGPPLTVAATKSIDNARKVKMNEDILSREPKSKLEILEHGRKHGSLTPRNGVIESSNTPSWESTGMVSIGRIPSPSRSLNSSKIKGSFDEMSNASTSKEKILASDGSSGKIDEKCSVSINHDEQLGSENPEVGISNTLVYDNSLFSGNQRPQLHCNTENLQEDLISPLSDASSAKTVASVAFNSACSGGSSWSDIHASALHNQSSETDDFDSQRLSDPIVAIPTNSSFHSNLLNSLLSPSGLHSDGATVVNHNVNPPTVHKQADNPLLSRASNSSNVFLDNGIGYSSAIGSSHSVPNGAADQQIKSDDVLNHGVDAIENSIISNILSLDLDTWDEPLTSQNLVKLLGESERQQASLNRANSWRAQSSNQSRFSFARQDSRSQMFDAESSFNREVMRTHSYGSTFLENRDPCLERLPNGFSVPHHSVDSFPNNQSTFSANMPNTSRAQISAPPGFAAPSRVPPPGFSSHDRNGQSFDMNCGNNLYETNFLRNPYQSSASTNSSFPTDIEFIDPAILAVGKGRVPNGLNNSSLDARTNFSSQSLGFESNSRLQLLMQRSLSAQQSQMFGEVLDNSSHHDGYGFTTRSLEPSQTNNISSFSQFSRQPRNGVVPNGHYDAWPDVHGGNNAGISELLRNDRLCFNKFYGGYEDPKYQISSSGDLYNRTFGI